MKNRPAPLIVVCYNRIKLLKQLIISLKKNNLTKKTTIYFFVDLCPNKNTHKKIIDLLNNVNFFYKKKIIIRKKKLGLKTNVLKAINYVFKFHKKLIVLEDDLVLTKNTLEYFNKTLNKFEYTNKIYSISGFAFMDKNDDKIFNKNNLLLSKRPCSWGWATWKHKWNSLEKINLKKINFINSTYGNDLILMNLKKRNNNLDSWAYDWTLKHILNNKFCIYPRYSFVKNNGFDNFSTNNFFKLNRNKSSLVYKKFDNLNVVEENKMIKKKFKKFYDQFYLFFLIKFFIFKLSIYLK
tara:strand:+ start:2177 stop:3061 length:885 start_codon:yes stop_codon:yes gene_type:complete